MKRKIELPASIKKELNLDQVRSLGKRKINKRSQSQEVGSQRSQRSERLVDAGETQDEGDDDHYSRLLGLKKGKLSKEFIQDGLADLLSNHEEEMVDHKMELEIYRKRVPVASKTASIPQDKTREKNYKMELAKYVPPQVREESVDLQLKRTVKGFLNRLSDGNMESILGQINDLYRQSARRDVSVAIVTLLLEISSDSSQLNDSYLLTFAAFSTVIYHSVGLDFGSYLVEEAVKKLKDKVQDKARGNLTTLLGYLYSFGVISCVLIYDLIKESLEKLEEIDVEILLRLLRICGVQIRADDPSALKEIIIIVNQEISKKDSKEIRYIKVSRLKNAVRD